MLAKCANPACFTPFRRLSEGKLFLVESESERGHATIDPKKNKSPRRTEYFWLCTECARFVTLDFSAETGVVTVPITGINGSIPQSPTLRKSVTAERTPGLLARAAGFHHD